MEADYELHEIVCVIHGFRLVDCESYERQYWRNDRRPLVPGYYVVRWPDECPIRRFNSHASFYGPFKHKSDAREAIGQLQLLGEIPALMLANESTGVMQYGAAA